MKLRTKAKVWLYPGVAAWHFVTIGGKEAERIKKNQEGKLRRGWGAVKVRVTLGKSVWETSIFPDKGRYLLPLKANVRKKEDVFPDDVVTFTIETIAL